MITRMIIIAALTLPLAGCFSGPSAASRAITVAYEDVDGTVKFRKIYVGGHAPDNGPARSLCDSDCIQWLEGARQ